MWHEAIYRLTNESQRMMPVHAHGDAGPQDLHMQSTMHVDAGGCDFFDVCFAFIVRFAVSASDMPCYNKTCA